MASPPSSGAGCCPGWGTVCVAVVAGPAESTVSVVVVPDPEASPAAEAGWTVVEPETLVFPLRASLPFRVTAWEDPRAVTVVLVAVCSFTFVAVDAPSLALFDAAEEGPGPTIDPCTVFGVARAFPEGPGSGPLGSGGHNRLPKPENPWAIKSSEILLNLCQSFQRFHCSRNGNSGVSVLAVSCTRDALATACLCSSACFSALALCSMCSSKLRKEPASPWRALASTRARARAARDSPRVELRSSNKVADFFRGQDSVTRYV